MRFEAAARMIRTSVVLAAANILNTVVVTPYLTVHLRYTALPAVSNRDFKTTGTVSLWRVAEPDLRERMRRRVVRRGALISVIVRLRWRPTNVAARKRRA